MGEREITARSDVYALGVVLYEMLTGDPPFTGSTAQAIVARVLTEAPRPILPQRHTIPPEVEAAVLTALEKLPADRFGTAAEFAEALAGRRHDADERGRNDGRGPAAARREAGLDPVKLAPGRRRGGLGRALRRGAGSAPAPAPEVNRFSVYLPPSEALAPVNQSGNRVAISPDGQADGVRRVRRQRGTQFWLREHDQLTSPRRSRAPKARARRSSRPTAGRSASWSAGRRVRTVSLDGGPTLTLTDSANSTGGDWGPDGYVYFEVDSGHRAHPCHWRSDRAGLQRSRPGRRPVRSGRWCCPAAKGIDASGPGCANQADRRLPDRGHEAAQGRAARAHARRLRALLADRAPAGRHRRRQAHRGAVRPRQARVHRARRSGLLEGIGVEVGGFSTNVALSDTGTLVYTTGSATRARQPVWVTREGLESPVDSTLAAAGHRRLLRALARRPMPWPWRCSRTATARSGSSSSRRDRSRGSPSATPRISGPPGPRTGAR